MFLKKRIGSLFGIALIVVGAYYAFSFVYTWRHISEAYAAWDAGEMLVWYMETHDGDWPSNWNELERAVDSSNSVFLRGRNGDDPDYWNQLQKTVRIDWTFEPVAGASASPVTRPDGSQLVAYWRDPN